MNEEKINNIPLTKTIGDVIEYIDKIFKDAFLGNVSDIHIETLKDYILLRFRQDGDFIIKEKIGISNYSAVITRLKVLSKVKIDENKKPQDGKIVFKFEAEDGEEKVLDMRASFLPTVHGEKVVLRLLRQDNNLNTIDDLGLLPINKNKVLETLKSKYGIILVAGPTGSGKSTTLFGLLKNFNPLEYNISTLEDPVEYNMQYVNQSQIRPDIGYTFASGLRSLVRQDPDIIMVGEIRDVETSLLSIEAALTGHLVMSTIHTNSAAGTIQRLINMGIEPFLIASALKMVISQRLVKKICTHCKTKINLDEVTKSRLSKELGNILTQEDIDSLNFYKGTGCDKCSGTGYKGRVGIHEILNIDLDIEKTILQIDSVSEIERVAKSNGMITIIQDALIKASMGETTIDEAFTLV